MVHAYFADFFERFGSTLDFLTDRNNIFDLGNIEITDDRINVTKDGFQHYGPLFSLFYHPELITLK